MLTRAFAVTRLGFSQIGKLGEALRRRGVGPTLSILRGHLIVLTGQITPRTIWGTRIGLRPALAELSEPELEIVYGWARDEEIGRLTGSAPVDSSFDEFRDLRRKARSTLDASRQVFFIVTRSGEMMGKISLESIDWAAGEGELGIFLDQRSRGKRYGPEAINLLIRLSFTHMGLKRVYLGTSSENVRAQRSFEACGFRHTGLSSRFHPIHGEEVESVKMEIRREDFLRQTS